jgi:phosphatidylglycerol:prolipoprotein diacylglycerol transferase
MSKIALSIGTIDVTWYSVFILIGVLIASLLFIGECKKYQINTDFSFNLIFWAVIFGIIGARIYFVLFNIPYYEDNPGEIYKIWNGGLAIHGGIIAGLLFLIFYSKKYKVRVLKITDMAAVGLIMAQAIGRWGNFFNGEAHGPEVLRSTLEGLKIIPTFVINGMHINGVYYQPTFYYESLWCILGFIVLICIRKFYEYLKAGQLTGIYLMWYSIGRFFIEGLRTDSLMLGDFKVAKLVSILMFIIGLILAIRGFKGSKFEDRYDDYETEDIKF